MQYKHSIYVQTCKLFADLERMRLESERRDQADMFLTFPFIFH